MIFFLEGMTEEDTITAREVFDYMYDITLGEKASLISLLLLHEEMVFPREEAPHRDEGRRYSRKEVQTAIEVREGLTDPCSKCREKRHRAEETEKAFDLKSMKKALGKIR